MRERFTDPEWRQKVASSVHAFWSSGSELTEQCRKDACERACRLLAAGIIGPGVPFKTQWIVNPFTGKQEYMHSSWETAFLAHCVAEGVPVTKDHAIRIPYVGLDGNEHSYIPDFVTLPHHPERLLFEVKGRMTETDDIKFVAAERWCAENGHCFVKVSNLV